MAEAAIDRWSFWRECLEGKAPELPNRPNTPCGYYRDRDAALAVWTDENGALAWERTPRKYVPRNEDELYDAFAYFSRGHITYEAYTAFIDSGKWPEDVAERPVEHGGIGHNSGETAPFELLRERIKDVGEQVKEWLASIGGAIATQEQADKAANFKSLFAELEKEAVAAHKVAKDPHLKAGREVDAAWKPIVELADASKRKAAALVTPYLVEQDRRAKEVVRLAAEEARRAEEERASRAQADGFVPEVAPVPVASIAPEKPKAGTRGRTVALRTVKRVEITDLGALAAYLVEINSADLRAVCERSAHKMLLAGVTVPGAELREEKVAA